ncbi:MAG: hypothetical protein ACE3JN_10890 [Ectobacillus sp.]
MKRIDFYGSRESGGVQQRSTFISKTVLNLIVDFPLQADAFRGRGRAAFPAEVAAFHFKSTLAFNRAISKTFFVANFRFSKSAKKAIHIHMAFLR